MCFCVSLLFSSGLSSLGVPGEPWHPQILKDQLTLFQPGGTNYAHLITTGTPRFTDLPTVLESILTELLVVVLVRARLAGGLKVGSR